jgi:hypothetical protein
VREYVVWPFEERVMPRDERTSLLAFIDSYKYDSGKLLDDLREHPELENQMKRALGRVSDTPEWPREFRKWQTVLFALLGNEIGGIASPILREAAARNFYESAESLGITSTTLGMVMSDMERLRRAVQSVEIRIPEVLG